MTLEQARRGQRVRCEREEPARGTWARFAGRTGRIAVVNPDAEELAVELEDQRGVFYWFKPSELVLETVRPTSRRSSREDG